MKVVLLALAIFVCSSGAQNATVKNATNATDSVSTTLTTVSRSLMQTGTFRSQSETFHTQSKTFHMQRGTASHTRVGRRRTHSTSPTATLAHTPTSFVCSVLHTESECVSSGCLWDASVNQCRTHCSRFVEGNCPGYCATYNRACRQRCPTIEAPVYCATTGLCAPTATECLPCPSTQVQCWNSSCVSRYAQCTCHPYTPIRCQDGACSPSDSQCKSQCPAVTCPDHTCAQTLEDCPCPPTTPVRCPGTWKCARFLADCSKVCPSTMPTRCWDATCVESPAGCSSCSPQEPYRCLASGLCNATLSMCPCPNNASAYRCDETRCAATENDCHTDCPSATPQRCNNGSCVAASASCPCTDDGTVRPSVQIQTSGNTVDTTAWIRASATVFYRVCGADLSLTVNTSWKVFRGAAVVDLGPASQVVGSVLAIAPNQLPVGYYTVVLTAKTRSSQTASQSFDITVVEPQPTLRIIGGNRMVSSLNVSLDAVITDRTVNSAQPCDVNACSWRCVWRMDDEQSPTEECSSTVKSQLLTQSGASMRLQIDVPAGIYAFELRYRNSTVSSFLMVVNETVPQATIYSATESGGDVWGDQTNYFWAAVTWSYAYDPSTIVYNWTVEDGPSSQTIGAQGRQFRILPNTIFGKKDVTLNVSINGRYGAAVTTLNFMQPPTGSCTVRAEDGSTTATMSSTQLTIRSQWNGTKSTFKYNFGYIAGSKFPLTYCAVDAPQLTFTAPVLSAGSVATFYVSLSDDTRSDISTTFCAMSLQAPSPSAASTLLEDGLRGLQAASAASSSLSIAVGLASVSNATTRSNVAKVIVTQLCRTVGLSSASLSSVERLVTVNLLSGLYTDPQAQAGSTDQTCVVQTLTAALLSNNTRDAVNATEAGPSALQLISSLIDTGAPNAAQQVAPIAKALTLQSPIGIQSNISGGNVQLSVLRLPASETANVTIASTSSSVVATVPMKIISTTAPASETAVALSVFSADPYNISQSNATLVSSVADVSLTLNGAAQSVNNLSASDVIPIQFKVSALSAGKRYVCMYLRNAGTASAQWAKDGVETAVGATNNVQCTTKHLSQFGVFAEAIPSTTTVAPSSPTATSSAPNSTTSTANASSPTSTSNSTTSTYSGNTTTPPSTTVPATLPGSGLSDDEFDVTTLVIVVVVLAVLALFGVALGVYLTRNSQDPGGTGARRSSTQQEETQLRVLSGPDQPFLTPQNPTMDDVL